MRASDHAPRSLEEWQTRRTELRQQLLNAWGHFPATDCDLSPRSMGGFQRDGYRVERVIFQSRPDVWVTANAYIPDRAGKRPAILHVHGHWAGARRDPVVQSRCIGCAKLGFFVLCVDAFGAGERGIGKAPGEYHGEMTAATLLPVGLPLSGLQVYENMRAVDYMTSRPEVDSARIGITGASGGGNQSMYSGAFDERIRCVVPTCSVGTYQAYLGAACCMCEVVPGALRFTEEGDVLGLAANRGLMVTSATRDAFQFSVGESQKSVARAEAIASLYEGATVRHTIIDSPHDYNRPMREAMYGWMARHLSSEGDGSPIPDPDIHPEDPELLSCFPAESRPVDFVTIPRFAAAEARRLANNRNLPLNRQECEQSQVKKRAELLRVLGGLPAPTPVQPDVEDHADGSNQTLSFETEAGLRMFVRRDLPERPGRMAIVLDLDAGAEAARSGELANGLRLAGWSIVAPELRATGTFTDPRDRIGNAPDHNTAEWSLWIGRPLLGQWVHDVRRTLDAIAERDGSLPHDVLVIGRGSSAVLALCVAALDERITRVKALEPLATFVTDKPFRGVRLGLMVPGILRDFGDVSDIAALVAPRPVTIVGGIDGTGVKLESAKLRAEFTSAKQAFDLLEATGSFATED